MESILQVSGNLLEGWTPFFQNISFFNDGCGEHCVKRRSKTPFLYSSHHSVSLCALWMGTLSSWKRQLRLKMYHRIKVISQEKNCVHLQWHKWTQTMPVKCLHVITEYMPYSPTPLKYHVFSPLKLHFLFVFVIRGLCTASYYNISL